MSLAVVTDGRPRPIFGASPVLGSASSIHQRIRPESVLDMKLVIPPSNLVEAFTRIAVPKFNQINRNIDQSRTLPTQRDTLWPND
ncbi:MAG TPA: hypothetical protein PLX89_12425 [Verrucomicrobiota bacterium]|nr:hypothetical protein [Verrucomicrobiota bacterium]